MTKDINIDDLPLVSVIIPAYNSEATIQKSIESVLLQKIPLELIIINNASEDGTLEKVYICQKECHNPDITWRIINQKENIGVAAARNLGVESATATYVAFLDSDDWWEEEKLKKQLALLEETGGVLCSTGREFVTYSGKLTGMIVPVKPIITYRDLLYDNVINCSSVLIRTDVAREFPMGHDECHEDYITWLQVLKKYNKAYAINEPLLKYRRSEGSKSANKLKSAKMHYHSLRYAGINPVLACWYFIFYAFSGVLKHAGFKKM